MELFRIESEFCFYFICCCGHRTSNPPTPTPEAPPERPEAPLSIDAYQTPTPTPMPTPTPLDNQRNYATPVHYGGG